MQFAGDVSTVKNETRLNAPLSASGQLDTSQPVITHPATTSPKNIDFDSKPDSRLAVDLRPRPTVAEGAKPRGLSVPGRAVAMITPDAQSLPDAASGPVNKEDGGTTIMDSNAELRHDDIETLPAKP